MNAAPKRNTAMNKYEEKQEARRKRYKKKAEQLKEEAEHLHDQAHKMAEAIPFGQPILVGHHSEKRDRRYRERIHNTFGKSFECLDKSEYYEQKATAVGTGGISSDDPDALVKLKEKLESLKRSHALMKATNAAIRKGKTPDRQIPLARTGSDSVPGRGAAQAGLLWTHRIRVLFPSEQQGDAHLPRQTGGRCPFPAQKARFQVSSQQEYMGRDDVFKNSLIIRNKSKSWSY